MGVESVNLYELFCETASRQTDQPAVIGPGKSSLSYGELRESIDGMAERLRESGIRDGDSVGVHHPSGPEYIVLSYACWSLGACVVPIAVELRPKEKESLCRDIHVDHLLCQPRTLSDFEGWVAGEPCEVGRRIYCVPLRRLRDTPVGLRDIDPAFLRFTSGTTAAAKGVVLSHGTVVERIHAANDVLKIGPHDRIVFLLSMSYHFTVSIVSYLTFGAQIILCHGSFGQKIVDAIRSHRGTLVYGSPMHYEMMTAVPGSEGLPSLRAAISTTSRLPQETAQAFDQRFGVPIGQALGIIEIGLPCINLDAPREKSDSVGRILPAYRYRLMETSLGSSSKEIQFAGPGLIDAYYDPWRTRDQLMPDGWFSTGDLCEVDDEAFVFIRGRTKDLISVAGMKFFAQEVAGVLRSHPAVEECLVVARQHARLGEVACASVVLAADRPSDDSVEEHLRQHCEAHLAAYKVPRYFQFVDELPRTASGKVIRHVDDAVCLEGVTT